MTKWSPTLQDMEDVAAELAGRVLETPLVRRPGRVFQEILGPDAQVFLKLELLQVTGSFKPRGALAVIDGLESDACARGVTAISAGNHAAAVAYAAWASGLSAKVVMYETADPLRIALARSFGATVVLAPPGPEAFAVAEAIALDEGRTLIHPFEGPRTILGASTIGLEIARQAQDLDAVVVPVGGGGLCAGVALAIKAATTACEVLAVEPRGAAAMHASLAAGSPQRLSKVKTIADSLAPPFVGDLCFEVCRRHVDDIALVDDHELRNAMRLLCEETKLVTEPAGAAATAAILGPYRERLAGKRVAVIVCGGNIAPDRFAALIEPRV